MTEQPLRIVGVPGSPYSRKMRAGVLRWMMSKSSDQSSCRFGNGQGLDDGVSQTLADIMCNAADCVVTKNFSLLEPGLFARKYYARGIGVFLEVESEGPISQLVNCNFDSRCNNLPPAS